MSNAQGAATPKPDMQAMQAGQGDRRPSAPAPTRKGRGNSAGRVVKRKGGRQKKAVVDDQTSVQCTVCFKAFTSEAALLRHMRLKHAVGAAAARQALANRKAGLTSSPVGSTTPTLALQATTRTPRSVAALKPIYSRPLDNHTQPAHPQQTMAPFPPPPVAVSLAPHPEEYARQPMHPSAGDRDFLSPNGSNSVARSGSGESLAHVPNTPTSAPMGTIGTYVPGVAQTARSHNTFSSSEQYTYSERPESVKWSSWGSPGHPNGTHKAAYEYRGSQERPVPRHNGVSEGYYDHHGGAVSPPPAKAQHHGQAMWKWQGPTAVPAPMPMAYSTLRREDSYGRAPIPVGGMAGKAACLKFSISSLLGHE